MRLPRRVPWKDKSELEQVCKWIYSEEADSGSKRHAINRISAWRVNTAIPHALESTLALLAATLQDGANNETSAAALNSSALRQAYALAIVRMVNGLVDPLQQGAYARPIASIAAQIGLPSWLVELRHAATHEDLPSLEVLRQGANDALDWLLHNYFMPTLSSFADLSQQKPAIPLTPLAPLLKEYKSLLKLYSRDSSLRIKHKHELTRLFREFERWFGEAKVAAWEPELISFEDNDSEWKEEWAIERLCEALLDKGGLVPVSKKKRVSSKVTIGPPLNQAIWAPLLSHLSAQHPTFPSQLVNHITYVLGKGTDETTFEHSLAGWAMWIVEEWNDEPGCSESEVVVTLVTALGSREEGSDTRIIVELIKSLVQSDQILGGKVAMLLSTTEQRSTETNGTSPDDTPKTMQDRLDLLQAKIGDTATTTPDQPSTSVVAMDVDTPTNQPIAPGWTLLAHDTWKPCPIGIFVRDR